MNFQLFLILTTYLVLHALPAKADHPNEGQSALEELIKQAENQNLEIKQAKDISESVSFQKKSHYGLFLPHVFIEGGPQKSRFENDEDEGSSLYAKAEWNIFNGGRDYGSFRQSQNLENLSQSELEYTKNRIRIQVSQLYYELLYYAESLNLKETALKLNSEQLKLATAKKNSGLTTETDVIEFQLRESTLRSDLILIKQQQQQKARELSAVLGRLQQDDMISVKGHLTRPLQKYDRNQLRNSIDKQNLEIKRSTLNFENSKYEKKVSLGAFSPKIDIEALYGKLPSDEFVYSDENNYLLRLKISVPLFTGFNNLNTYRSKTSAAAAAEKNVQSTKISVNAKLESALDDIEVLNQRLDLEEKNLQRSEKYYALTLAEYRRGVKNSPDLVSATERVHETRLRNLEYRRDLILATLKVQELLSDK